MRVEEDEHVAAGVPRAEGLGRRRSLAAIVPGEAHERETPARDVG